MPKEVKLEIKTGNALVYYSFDVGTGIDLKTATKRLGDKAQRIPITIERLAPEHIQYKEHPVLVRLGKVGEAEAIAKLYDFGTITIRLRVPIQNTLESLATTCNVLTEKSMKAAATRAFEDIKKQIADLIEGPDGGEFVEDYMIIHVESFNRTISGKDLLDKHEKAIANILRCDREPLSAMQLSEAVRKPLSYYADDLIIIDTKAAFVYSAQHAYDVHDVIEYAIIELLELRRYDALLDDSLRKAHDDLTKKVLVLFNPYGSVLKHLETVRIDITSVVERIDNGLKLIGDSYLARIYSTASDRFGLDQWKESVRQKLNTIQDVYRLMTDRVNSNRLLFLEIVVALGSAFYLIEFILSHT